MDTTNKGNQNVGWMYTTPLRADHLNRFISATATPGLLTRTRTEQSSIELTSDSSQIIKIKPFAALITPTQINSMDSAAIDLSLVNLDVDKEIKNKLVKITVESDVEIPVTYDTVAIGLVYSLTTPGSQTPIKTYGKFIPIYANDLENPSIMIKYKSWNMIIIATATVSIETIAGIKHHYISFSSNGATLSSVLLEREGWSEGKYLGIPSLFALVKFDRGWNNNNPETVTHNNVCLNSFLDSLPGASYLNGWEGLIRTKYDNCKIFMNFLNYVSEESRYSLNGWEQFANSGFAIRQSDNKPYSYQVVVLSTHYNDSTNSYLTIDGGFDNVIENTPDVCLRETKGGIMGIIYLGDTRTMSYHDIWWNMKFIPVKNENVNIYYKDSDETLYIK